MGVDEETVARLSGVLNFNLAGHTADEITLPMMMKLEAAMGADSRIVNPIVKSIYDVMNEIDNGELKVSGLGRLLQYPEYSDVSDFRNLLGVLEEKDKLLDVISSHSTDDDGIHVYIGTENESDGMKNTTLIFKNINVGGKQLAVGVIGPKRMNYSKVIEMLNGLASGIDRVFGENALPPGKDD
jgi:heat-inducible transcriptional repressor